MRFSNDGGNIQAIAAGDKSALCRFYLCYRNDIYRYAYSITKDHQLAEDILQDTLVKISEKAYMYYGGNERSYVMKIVHNLSLDYLKKKNRETPTACVPVNEEQPTAAFDDLIELIPSSIDRQIVVLRIDLGYKIKEIAAILNMSENAVTKRYRNTLLTLKRMIK